LLHLIWDRGHQTEILFFGRPRRKHPLLRKGGKEEKSVRRPKATFQDEAASFRNYGSSLNEKACALTNGTSIWMKARAATTSTALGWMRCEMLRVMDWLIWF